MKKINLLEFFGVIIVAIVIDLILAYIFMLIWNACIPSTFEYVHTIPYTTAFGILMLCSCIKASVSTHVTFKKDGK